MKKIILIIFNFIIVCLCGCNNEDAVLENSNAFNSEHIIIADINDEEKNGDLIDDFLNGDIPAYYDNDRPLWFKDLLFDEAEWDSYSLGVRADFDNDGENEQILNGPYGGMCLDIQGDCVRIMAHGQGTATVLDYVLVDDIYWIVYKDTGHCRAYFHFIRYNGGENIEEEHILEWHDDENGERRHYYDDEVITEEKYEEIRMQYFEEK